MKNRRPLSTASIFVGIILVFIFLASGLSYAASSGPRYGRVTCPPVNVTPSELVFP